MYNQYDFNSNRVYYEDPKQRRRRQLQALEAQSQADMQRSAQKKNQRFSNALTTRNVLGQTGRAFQGTKIGDGLYKYTGQQALDALNNNPKEVITNMVNSAKNLADGTNILGNAGNQLVQNATNAAEATNATTTAGSTAQGIGTAGATAGTATAGAEAGSEAASAAGEAAGDAASSAGSAVPVAGIVIKAITKYIDEYKKAENEQNNKLMEASNEELSDAIKAGTENKLNAVKGLNETQSISDMINNHINNNAEARYEQLGIEKPEVMSLQDVTENLNKTKEKQMEEAQKNQAKADGGIFNLLHKPVELAQKAGAGLVKLTNNMTGIAPLARNIDTGIPAIEALDDTLEGKSKAYEEGNPLVAKEDTNNALVNAEMENMQTGPTQSAKNATENISKNTDDPNVRAKIKDIMSQIQTGYADNRGNSFDIDNLARDPEKTGWNKLGEAGGTLMRLASNPYVQGAIAGGLYGASKGDALYGLNQGWNWAQSKAKSDRYYRDITGRDDAPIFNDYDLDDYKAHKKNENDQREYDRKLYNDEADRLNKDEDQKAVQQKHEEYVRHNKAMEGIYSQRNDIMKNRDNGKTEQQELYNADLAEFTDIFNNGDQGQIEYARKMFMQTHGKDPFKYIKLTSDWEEQVGY